MLLAIKKQFQVQWKDWAEIDGIIWGAGLIGILIFQVILRLDPGSGEWFALGTLIGGIAAVIFIVVVSTVQISICFNLQVSMGSTRKQFLISWFAVLAVESVAAVLLLTALCLCENRLYSMWYPNMKNEVDFLPYLIKYGILAAVAVTALGSCCGALVMRFGKKAFWTLWIIWMVLWIGFPRIISAAEDAPGSFYGKIGSAVSRMFGAVPASLWVALIIGASLAGIALTCGLLRKQPVTR